MQKTYLQFGIHSLSAVYLQFHLSYICDVMHALVLVVLNKVIAWTLLKLMFYQKSHYLV
jgi:hypothetical protein